MQISEKTVPSIYGGPSSFALSPDGDSMDLMLPNGGYAIVDPDDTELKNGRSYVVMNGESEAMAKVYRADPPRLEPCSSNPGHQAIAIGATPFTVVGRIVGAMQEM